jgi:hypothetical protein
MHTRVFVFLKGKPRETFWDGLASLKHCQPQITRNESDSAEERRGEESDQENK